jgi:hypothetical protein
MHLKAEQFLFVARACSSLVPAQQSSLCTLLVFSSAVLLPVVREWRRCARRGACVAREEIARGSILRRSGGRRPPTLARGAHRRDLLPP